ncbi:DUF3027 domain-containing protein [uncultured Jatrophihabitans sp.]|uniref:DUF3027 domain-containing protein n=1 Tax=uncultured Jatrophihabitans sp. TaxID=1610747 RepID=UPI0035CA867D
MSSSDDTTSSPGTTGVLAERDDVLASAIDVAYRAAVDAAGIGGGDAVGEHLGVRAETTVADEPVRVATHAFASTLPGYVGWHWGVTLARTLDDEHVTVDEVVLLPGDDALLAPVWVPWQERVQPGDLAPGDLLPARQDDPRLVPAYVADDTDDPVISDVAFELGLGREQVLSRDGRLDAADRWHGGERGPDTPMARQAPGHCGTCGFLLALAGSLRAGFGVCGNGVTDTDGQVVSVEYGCGAHSQVQAAPTPLGDAVELVYDDGDEITPKD